MPPVELDTVPHTAVPVETTAPTKVGLKVVEKALVLPIINDAVTVASKHLHHVTKLHEQVAKFPTYTYMENIVQDGIIVPTKKVAGQLPEGVKMTMAHAVEQLDTMAVTGLDQLTTKVPALTTPTEELITATTEATHGVITATTEVTKGVVHTITTATLDVANTVLENVASFNIAQTGLKMVDTGLSITEKVFHHLEPGQEWFLKPLATIPWVATMRTYATPVVSKIGMVRRHLRAVRHAGRRNARSAKMTLGGVSMIGYVLEMFHINFILGMFGMVLTPAWAVDTKVKHEHDDLETTNEDETLEEKLSEEKMEAYESSQDPDYEPTEEETEDPLEFNTDAEISQEDASQEDVSQEDVTHEETTTTTHETATTTHGETETTHEVTATTTHEETATTHETAHVDTTTTHEDTTTTPETVHEETTTTHETATTTHETAHMEIATTDETATTTDETATTHEETATTHETATTVVDPLETNVVHDTEEEEVVEVMVEDVVEDVSVEVVEEDSVEEAEEEEDSTSEAEECSTENCADEEEVTFKAKEPTHTQHMEAEID